MGTRKLRGNLTLYYTTKSPARKGVLFSLLRIRYSWMAFSLNGATSALNPIVLYSIFILPTRALFTVESLKMNRYERQIQFLPFGFPAQQNLQHASVVIVGCGGLGCTLACWLARAGVGKIRLVDDDVVSLRNIHRQILFTDEDENRPKVLAAVEHLRKIASSVLYEPICEKIDVDHRDSLVAGVELILDATDNYAARFHLNRASLRHSIPWIHAGVAGAQGQIFSILPGKTPCLECLFPNLAQIANAEMPEPDKPAGILGPAVGVIASFQAMEAMKILSGKDDCLNPSLMTFDFWKNRVREVEVSGLKNATCVCRESHEKAPEEKP